jgi:hypothetical protein
VTTTAQVTKPDEQTQNVLDAIRRIPPAEMSAQHELILAVQGNPFMRRKILALLSGRYYAESPLVDVPDDVLYQIATYAFVDTISFVDMHDLNAPVLISAVGHGFQVIRERHRYMFTKDAGFLSDDVYVANGEQHFRDNTNRLILQGYNHEILGATKKRVLMDGYQCLRMYEYDPVKGSFYTTGYS